MFQLKTARIGAVHMESRYTKLRKKGMLQYSYLHSYHKYLLLNATPIGKISAISGLVGTDLFYVEGLFVSQNGRNANL